MKRGLLIASTITFTMVILMTGLVSSFAVGSEYWEEKPLIANPGDTVEYFVVLQNIAGEGGDVDVQGAFSEGGDIATFADETGMYFVPFGEKKNVDMIITIPEDAEAGIIPEANIDLHEEEILNVGQLLNLPPCNGEDNSDYDSAFDSDYE